MTHSQFLFYSQKLKNKKSVGFDGLSSHVLKQIAPSIAVPLAHIFNLSLRTGYIPLELKISRVIPLFKSGEPDDFGNYRPISILPALSKLFEMIVNDQIRNYFNCYSYFTDAQFGFQKGSSPILAVSKFIDRIFAAKKDISLGVFIDAKKAFDTVDHDILIKKLEHYGFCGPELKLLENYLKNRMQKTEVNGVASELIKILARQDIYTEMVQYEQNAFKDKIHSLQCTKKI